MIQVATAGGVRRHPGVGGCDFELVGALGETGEHDRRRWNHGDVVVLAGERRRPARSTNASVAVVWFVLAGGRCVK